MKREGLITAERKTRKTLPDARERAILAARIAEENRGRDIVVLQLKGLVEWVDYLVIATGTSRRQIITMSDEIQAGLKETGDRILYFEGTELGNWVVLDYGDIHIDLFDEEKRGYYQLEHLWADAPQIHWQRPVPPGVAAIENEGLTAGPT